MWVAYVLNYADRNAIFSIFPVLRSQLNFTDIQLALSSSLFLWVYGICSPVAGLIGDRISKRFVVAFSLVLWSGATLMTGLAKSAWMILMCRALTGITEALFMPAAVVLTAYAQSERTRSLAIGLLSSAQMAGLILGGWYGGFIAQEFGWRVVFYSLGMLGVLYSIPYWIFLEGTCEEATIRRTRSFKAESKRAIVGLVKVPTYGWLCLCSPSYTSLLWLLYTWLPDLLHERFSLSLAESGFSATVYLQSATFLGLLAGGAVSDWLYLHSKAARFGLLCAGILFSSPWAILIAHSHSLFFLKVAACGFGFGSGVFMANFFISAFEVVPANSRASAVGLINFIGTPVSGAVVLMAGMWKATLGISNLITYWAMGSIFFGLLLVRGFTSNFQKDSERSKRLNGLSPLNG